MTDKVHAFKGDAVTITFDRGRCLHAEECVRGSRQVFDPTRRRWIDPSGADPETIVETVHRCPTGALHYLRHDGGPGESPEPVNRISVDPDGPLYVRGTVQVMREDGSEVVADTRIALCRCGHSRRKPFCDGSHQGAGFRDPGRMEPVEESPAGSADGPLLVTLRIGGPMLLEGPVEIVAADGCMVRRTRVSLCRCGGSNHKPFCDGSHGRIGFTAD